MKKTFRIKRFYDTNKKNKNQVIKKFIFSAVAMIAFVGSSMANDIAEEHVSSKSIVKSELEIGPGDAHFVVISKCENIFIKTYALAKEDFSNDDALKIANGAFQACVELDKSIQDYN